MSMREYSYVDVGVVLAENEVVDFANKYLKVNNPKLWEDVFGNAGNPVEECADEITAYDCEEYCDSVMTSVAGFFGTASVLGKDGVLYDDGCVDNTYAEETVFYLMMNFPTMFKPAYVSYEEMLNDAKEKYGKYLPDDFDFARHICFINGTYWG